MKKKKKKPSLEQTFQTCSHHPSSVCNSPKKGLTSLNAHGVLNQMMRWRYSVCTHTHIETKPNHNTFKCFSDMSRCDHIFHWYVVLRCWSFIWSFACNGTWWCRSSAIMHGLLLDLIFWDLTCPQVLILVKLTLMRSFFVTFWFTIYLAF